MKLLTNSNKYRPKMTKLSLKRLNTFSFIIYSKIGIIQTDLRIKVYGSFQEKPHKSSIFVPDVKNYKLKTKRTFEKCFFYEKNRIKPSEK